MVCWSPHGSDVVSRKYSKATGVAKVMNKLELNPEDLSVFEDEVNDLDLFDYAEISIVMEISHEKFMQKQIILQKQ